MKSIREILRLSFSCQLSGRRIAKMLSLSRSAVWECLRRARGAQISWPIPDDLDEDSLYALLYPPEPGTPVRPAPDCAYIHQELKRKGMTLGLLWEEYKQQNPNGYQYTQFCDKYRAWGRNINLSMRQEHTAGQKAFSDFSGGTIRIIDPETGEVHQAKLFVSALGASSFTYAELFPSESTQSWCLGQANAFLHFGGSTELLIPDNPRAVVTKACRYEPDIHPDFLLLAEHFDVAVVPARVRRPKDKAIVEAAVGLATRWILARLRNQDFFSLAEANVAVKALLNDLNERPFKKMPGCRRTLFESVEKPALKPLPQTKYSFTHVEYAKADNSYHIQVEGSHYSVPHTLVGERLEVRISAATIEVFHNRRRVASHARLQKTGALSRLEEHMPATHRAYKSWTPQKFASWAATIGPATTTFIERMITVKKYPELAYRACFGIMRLAKEHGRQRMEGACQRATAVDSYSYSTVKLILQNNMDCRPLPTEEVPAQLSFVHENIRGANYFTQKENENADQSDNRIAQESEVIRHGQVAGDTDADTGYSKSAV